MTHNLSSKRMKLTKDIYRFFVPFAFLLVISSSINAKDCEDAMTTLEINQCVKADMDRAEVQLQEVFKSVLERHNHNTVLLALLNESQRHWQVYRSSYCDALYQRWISGSILNIQALSCEMDLIRQRIKLLKTDFLLEPQ